MTLPRQEGVLAIDDPDHQVQWLEGARLSHTCHHKGLSCSPRFSAWVHGGTSDDETPRLALPTVDGPPRPLASLVRCQQQLFSKYFLFDSLVFLEFRVFLLDFFEIQRCFVDRRTKFYSSVVFSWKGGSFHCKILFL